MATVVGASRNLPANEAPNKGQLVEACRDFEADLASGDTEASHDIMSA